MRKFLLLVGALFLLGAANADAQAMKPRFVIMDDYIRAQLAADWDAHSKDHIKLERAYCLRYQYDVWAGEVAYRVTQISKPDSVTDADPSSILFYCPAGTQAEIHIHPQQTCVEKKDESYVCWDGGPYANQCLPSEADRYRVTWLKEEFGMVQCGRESTVFYFGTGDNR
jgi:hypothetical protein